MITFCEKCANWHEEGQHNPHIVPPEEPVNKTPKPAFSSLFQKEAKEK